MFTGIIEEIGVIKELDFVSAGARVTIGAPKIGPQLKIGDSVSVDGVCLTATRIGKDSFTCDVSPETLRVSCFREMKPGRRVNLERALAWGDRLGGHLVQGHVDGLGRLSAKKPSGQGYEMSFQFPRSLERYLIHKGSIAVNGISLTIATLDRECFSVAVIPHTYESTNLGWLKIGDAVNLEVDMLGKYFERFFQLGVTREEKPAVKLTMEYLKSQGF